MNKKLLLIILISLILPLSSLSQSYKISITNGVFVNEYNYEFDVVIRCRGDAFDLTSYQVVFNCFLESNHELTFSYIPGTSQLNNQPLFATGTIISNDNRLLTFASLPGNDLIGEEEKKIGRFLLTSSQNLMRSRAFIFWNFEGDIYTILTGPEFNNITSLGSFSPTKGTNLNFDEFVLDEYETSSELSEPI